MFWKKYLDLCDAINKSPSAVAREIGMSNSTTNAWKNGAMPQQRTLLKIANYFNVPISYFEEKEKPTPDNQSGDDPLQQELDSLLPLLSRDQKKLVVAQMRFLLSDKPE